MGLRRVGHNWATSLSLFTFMHWRGKWQPTPVFLPGESQGREPSGLLSMGLHRVGHDWRDLAAAVAVTQIVIIAFCANRTHECCMEGHWWRADQGMYSVSTPTDMLLFNSDTITIWSSYRPCKLKDMVLHRTTLTPDQMAIHLGAPVTLFELDNLLESLKELRKVLYLWLHFYYKR